MDFVHFLPAAGKCAGRACVVTYVDGIVQRATLVASGGCGSQDSVESESGLLVFCLGVDLQLCIGAVGYKILCVGDGGFNLSPAGRPAGWVSR